MPLIQVLPKSKMQVCTINAEGKFSIPASILDKLEWQHGSRISLTYLENPLTVILKRINNDDGFKLMRRTSPTSPNPAGILTCAAFTNTVLKSKIVLPIRNISPVILNRADSKLALTLETPAWTQVEFSQSGRQLIPTNLKGVYQLLDLEGEVMRIGEGVINNRVAQHLKNGERLNAVHFVQYIPLIDKEEMELLSTTK